MNDLTPRFRERLLEMERVTPALKEHYARELQAMYEKQLTGFRRWSFLIAGIAGIGFAIGFGVMAVMMPPGFPLLGRLTFAAGALFGVGWAVLGFRVFRRGRLNMKIDNAWALRMGAALPLLVAIALMASAPETIGGLRMAISGVFWFVFAAIFMIHYVIDRSTLETREKLLEIELRLAELSERIKA